MKMLLPCSLHHGGRKNGVDIGLLVDRRFTLLTRGRESVAVLQGQALPGYMALVPLKFCWRAKMALRRNGVVNKGIAIAALKFLAHRSKAQWHS